MAFDKVLHPVLFQTFILWIFFSYIYSLFLPFPVIDGLRWLWVESLCESALLKLMLPIIFRSFMSYKMYTTQILLKIKSYMLWT